MPKPERHAQAQGGKPPPADVTITAGPKVPLQLRWIHLWRFRNIHALSLELTTPRLLVVGPNGEGKSNFLEGVELLTSLRSHRCGSDRDLIGQGQAASRLRAITGEGDELELHLRRSGGRQALRNGKVLDRQLDLIGSLRCVGFSALDLEMVRGEPALRRQWLDRVVLQLEPVYGHLISRYGRLLRQRNQLLRRGLGLPQRQELLDAFDQQMALIGTRVHRRRHRALRRLEPLAVAWQERLGGRQERVGLNYRAGTLLDLEGDDEEEPWRRAMEEQLRAQRSDEERLGQCLVGPHRDEVDMVLAERPARRYGSAGQQRTLLLAVKLAELELVRQVVGQPPLLLLDDVLAELDPSRQHLLLEAVGEGHQCLVSATHLGAFGAGWRRASQVVTMRQGALVDGDA